MATATEMTELKRIAEGPHILHIDRSARPDGSKKLSASLLMLPHANVSEDMLLEPIIARRCASEKQFEMDDIMPNKEQRESILHQATILAVQSLTKHASDFKKYADEPLFQFQRRRPLPDEHRTRTFPVASSIGENFAIARFTALIRGTYVTKLRLDEDSFGKRAIPCINDAMANASIRRAQTSPSTTDADRRLLNCLHLVLV